MSLPEVGEGTLLFHYCSCLLGGLHVHALEGLSTALLGLRSISGTERGGIGEFAKVGKGGSCVGRN